MKGASEPPAARPLQTQMYSAAERQALWAGEPSGPPSAHSVLVVGLGWGLTP